MRESNNRLRGVSNERSTDRGRGIILVRQITVLILMYGPRIFDKKEKRIIVDVHRFANLLEESVMFLVYSPGIHHGRSVLPFRHGGRQGRLSDPL
jgi:hypothetical protein